MSTYSDLESLSDCAAACRSCVRMEDRARVLGKDNGTPNAKVMFIAEAPGRLGADRTCIPLHGDRTGDNFEHLLASIRWQREDLFITNSVLCNPRTEAGLNGSPTKEEIRNCSVFLTATLRLVQPWYIVTLGAAALEALSFIRPHTFCLQEDVRTLRRWNGFNLIPLYHPGPRALVHRNMRNMESDFQRLREVIGDPRKPSRPPAEKVRKKRALQCRKGPLADVLLWLIKHLEPLSLFRLHKLLYLAEVECREAFGAPFLGIYFLRQKDGPFAPAVSRTMENLQIQDVDQRFTHEGPTFSRASFASRPALDSRIEFILQSIATKFGHLDNRGIKIAAYRNGPMRDLIKNQQKGSLAYNRPLFADANGSGQSELSELEGW